MQKKLIFYILLLIVTTPLLYSLTINEIRYSENYISGYGEAKLVDEELSLYTVTVNDITTVRPVPMLFTFPNNDRQFIDKLAFVINEENKIEP